MAKSKSTAPAERAAEVLLARGTVRADELLDAIHAVNPTGLELSRAAERTRYGLKARLQSLLIARFGQSLSVEPVSAEEGVVSLRYGSLGQDACHAVISELDDAARAWVRGQLDAASLGAAAPLRAPVPPRNQKAPRARPPAGAGGLLAQGRQALEAYDFEQARACFEAAFEDAPDDAGAAAALLELLVDHLAAFGDALGASESLSGAAAADPAVRALCALAAAHTGRWETCLRWIPGADPARATEASAVAASAAVDAGDWPAAQELLAAAETLGVASTGLLEARDKLLRRRAEQREPDEQALLRQAATADDDAVAAAAHRLLEAWPDSALAGRLLREVESRRATARDQAAERAGDEALLAGQAAQALLLWSGIAVPSEAVAAKVARARIAAAEADRRLRVSGAVARLREAIDATGLASYAALEAAERTRVRSEVDSAELGWLEVLEARATADAAIPAVLAWGQARLLDPAKDAELLLTLLRPWESVLGKLPQAVEALAVARAARDKDRVTQSTAVLEEAERALAAGDAKSAVRLLENSRPSSPPALRERHEGLAQRAREEAAAGALAERVDALLANGQPLLALDLLWWAPAWARAHSPEAWADRAARARGDAARVLEVERFELGPSATAPEYIADRTAFEKPLFTLDVAAGEWFWVTAEGGRVFLRAFRMADGALVRGVALLAPEAFDEPEAHLHDGRVWMTGASGAVLAIEAKTGMPCFWRSGAQTRQAHEVLEQALVVPGGRTLWASVRAGGGLAERTRVIDLERGRVARELPRGVHPELLLARDGPRVFVMGTERQSWVCAPHGATELTLERAFIAGAGPGLEGVVALTESEEGILRAQRVGTDGRWGPALPLPEIAPDLAACVTGLECVPVSFVLGQDDQGTHRLFALGAREAALELRWSSQVPAWTRVVQDLGGKKAVAAAPGLRGPVVRLLDVTPVDFSGVEEVARARPPMLREDHWCGAPPVPEGLRNRALAIEQMPPARQREAVEDAARELASEPGGLVAWVRELRRAGLVIEADHVQALLPARSPEDPWVTLDAAEHAWKAKDVEGTLALLERGPAQPADAARWPAHHHHLRTLALYRLGRFAEAFEAASAGTAALDGQEDGCELEAWAGWLAALVARGTPSPVAVELIGRVRQADAALERADVVGALEALDAAACWVQLEPQLAARLGVAALGDARTTPEARFRRAIILARCEDVLAERISTIRRELPLGTMRWSAERLAEVKEAIRKVLSG